MNTARRNKLVRKLAGLDQKIERATERFQACRNPESDKFLIAFGRLSHLELERIEIEDDLRGDDQE